MAVVNWMPLVGPVAGRLENSGMDLSSPGAVMNRGTSPVMSIGLGPVAPPTALLPLPKLAPSWVPMSRANVRWTRPRALQFPLQEFCGPAS